MNHKPFLTKREFSELNRRLELAGVPAEFRRLDANTEIVETMVPFGSPWPWGGKFTLSFPDIIVT